MKTVAITIGRLAIITVTDHRHSAGSIVLPSGQQPRGNKVDEEDKILMEQIYLQADRAEHLRPATTDVKALAMALGATFEHRSVEEIEEKIKDVWRVRKLYFIT